MFNFFNNLFNNLTAFSTRYVFVALLATLAIVVFFTLVNALYNKYCKFNRLTNKLNKTFRRALKDKQALTIATLKIPTQIANQWQLLTSGQIKLYPSQILLFDASRQTIKLLFVTTAATLIALAMCVITTIATANYNFLFVAFALISFVLLNIGLVNSLNNAKVKSTNKTFARFICAADKYLGCDFFVLKQASLDDYCKDCDIDSAVSQIEIIKKSGTNENTAKDIAQLLNSDKLKKLRTPAQQQKINLALNGLLHLISNKATPKPTPIIS